MNKKQLERHIDRLLGLREKTMDYICAVHNAMEFDHPYFNDRKMEYFLSDSKINNNITSNENFFKTVDLFNFDFYLVNFILNNKEYGFDFDEDKVKLLLKINGNILYYYAQLLELNKKGETKWTYLIYLKKKQ